MTCQQILLATGLVFNAGVLGAAIMANRAWQREHK